MSQPSSSRAGSLRQRSKKACQPCRRRKRKCDGQYPCATCVEFEYACEYDEVQQQQQQADAVGRSRTIATSESVASPKSSSVARPLLPAASEGDNYYEPNKHRYYDTGSAVSFPRALALSLKAGYQPRLHSFAYNIGPLQERYLGPPEVKLSDLVEIGSGMQCAKQYFATVNKVFYVVDQDDFRQQFRLLWVEGAETSLHFQSLACFVILLGSLFSWPNSLAEHQDLADHAQVLLDRSSFHHAPSLLRLEHAQAWVLRTIHQRCSTRPNITWISSCITMHVLETLGLHREYDTLGTMGLTVPVLSDLRLETRRRVFWVAWTLNRMVAFELGRSATFVSSCNITLPAHVPGTATTGIIGAYRMIYPDAGHVLIADARAALASISQFAEREGMREPFIAMVCADVACGLYRQLHKESPYLHEYLGVQLVATVRQGLAAARNVLGTSQPWWMLISMPFQFICVAVAVGKIYIFDLLPDAMGLLEDVQGHFKTHVSQEAFETARALLEVALTARDQETSSIRQALNVHDPQHASTQAVLTGPAWDNFIDTNFPYGSWEPQREYDS